MKLRDSQSTFFYRLNLWSAGLPQFIQNILAIPVVILSVIVIGIFSVTIAGCFTAQLAWGLLTGRDIS